MATRKKKMTFRPFDAAEHLRTPEEIALFLAVAIEEAAGDLAVITDALNTVARARNMSELARQTGISREGLYKALSPDGNPSFDLVRRIVEAFGLRLTVTAAN